MGFKPRVAGVCVLAALVALTLAGSVRAPDTTPPVVAGVYVIGGSGMVGFPVTIQANVQDNVAVASVLVNVSQPDGSHVNATMPWKFTTYYELTRTWPLAGMYNMTAWASDTSGNWGHANGSFWMIPQDTTPPTIKDVVAYPPVQA